MTFSEKMKEYMDQGLQVSKDFMSKAGAKAQDLGEKGVLKLEVMQLQNQAQKLITRLGTEVYSAFSEHDAKTVSAEDPVINGILQELAQVKESIEKREGEMKNQ